MRFLYLKIHLAACKWRTGNWREIEICRRERKRKRRTKGEDLEI